MAIARLAPNVGPPRLRVEDSLRPITAGCCWIDAVRDGHRRVHRAVSHALIRDADDEAGRHALGRPVDE